MNKKKITKLLEDTFFTEEMDLEKESKGEMKSQYEYEAKIETNFGILRKMLIFTWIIMGTGFFYLTMSTELKTIFVTHTQKINDQDVELEVCKAALENIGTSHVCHKELFDDDTCSAYRNFTEPFSLDPKYFHVVGGWMRNGMCKVFAKDRKDGKPVLRIWLIKTHGKEKGFLIDNVQEIFGSALEHRRFNS